MTLFTDNQWHIFRVIVLLTIVDIHEIDNSLSVVYYDGTIHIKQNIVFEKMLCWMLSFYFIRYFEKLKPS